VLEDGTIEGFVGGVCAQHSVRLYSLRALESGEPVLLRILPDPDARAAAEAAATTLRVTRPLDPGAGRDIESEEGSVTVQNPCLSGGSIEVFLEPFLPAPRVIVAGESPIAMALHRLGPEVGLQVIATALESDPAATRPRHSDLALVVAAHGRDEVDILRAGLEAGIEYIGLVASHKRGAAVIEELRQLGVADELLTDIDYPAGLDIGARAPAEIALSILARIVEVRRSGELSGRLPARASVAPQTATDPICGMSVVIGADTPQVEADGAVVFFCCDGCKRRFEADRAA
jgi:xanthine dehydrogenase accessory factor